MNTQYRKNLKDVATACKNYTDKKIDDLKWELGSHTLDVESDTDVAYVRTVPSDVIGCQINKLGGMSYKSINIWDEQWEQGGYDNSGNKTTNTNLFRNKNVISIFPNTTYYVLIPNQTQYRRIIYDNNMNILSNTIGTANDTFTTPSNGYYMNFNVTTEYGGTYNNDICINVSNSSINGNYYPYFEDIRDSAVTSVVIKGFNVWDEQWEVGGYDDNGGTTSIQTIRSKNYISILPNTDYYFRMPNIANVTTRRLFYTINKELISSTSYSTIGTFTTPNNAYYMKFNTSTGYGTTYNNDICINLSNSANGTYKPYVQPITKQIPAEVQALEGYGWGINDTCYNYIDFETKKFVKKVGRVDLGNLNWIKNPNNGFFYNTTIGCSRFANDNNLPNLLCAKYSTQNNVWGNDVNVGSSYPDKSIFGWRTTFTVMVKDTSYATAAAFKTAMDGVYLYYELATPVETDISAYLTTNSIEVEGGGTLTFNNTYNQAVPSEVDYLIEEVKA